jgi:hypothetical protein
MNEPAGANCCSSLTKLGRAAARPYQDIDATSLQRIRAGQGANSFAWTVRFGGQLASHRAAAGFEFFGVTAKYANKRVRFYFAYLAYFAVYQFRLCVKVERNGTAAGKTRKRNPRQVD